MPALATTSCLNVGQTRPSLGHVSLMVDTFIANSTVEDLRAIVRGLLASGGPGITSAFTTAARSRMTQTNAKNTPNSSMMFSRRQDEVVVATSHLNDVLSRARSLYGAGMGFTSLGLLASVVRATIGLRWEEESTLADLLAIIDADIGQAIQSSKEEIENGTVGDFAAAREAVNILRSAVDDAQVDVESWNGEFPFERASSSLECWKF